MKQCINGHFYDQSKSNECPYCNSASANVNVTRSMWYKTASDKPVMGQADVRKTMANQADLYDYTRPINVSSAKDSERTVAVLKKEIGIDPVVGWLVCIEGKEKGRDYRIHSDNNFIGRSERMDVCIRGDDTISRDNHAIISFDVRDKIYYFSPGEGRSIVRVNGKAIFSTIELKAYDTIEIGNTKLMFVPLCGEGFCWM